MYSQNLICILTILLTMFQLNETDVEDLSTTLLCIPVTNTLRARHKSCLLRPDTGPCRADILQWYFDAKQNRCYRFFFGGCQGNGNRFDSRRKCLDYCYLDINGTRANPPYFCSLAFDFGTCFGHYYRWYWDNLYKACKRRIYSGCGGNQNNFQSLAECRAMCLAKQANNNSLIEGNTQITTCITVIVAPTTNAYRRLGNIRK